MTRMKNAAVALASSAIVVALVGVAGAGVKFG